MSKENSKVFPILNKSAVPNRAVLTPKVLQFG